ncbi:hypothetical protein THOG11_40273 [Vibrio harveyi]|nr:hypothetical protein TH15OA1_200018 [Vibrio harveyi]CAH1533457.1 hypothetical protein VHARVF571_330018 [Vibrio harveyi]CAH1557491.1 hypothetical protein THOD03_200018 [Vibrio harveyi]CAH1577921.1 hypothetical protein THOG11_40273 [Vibrio harveyi]CAK6714571.1 hypothetical protein HORM4_470020 [Vibrio harveyi]
MYYSPFTASDFEIDQFYGDFIVSERIKVRKSLDHSKIVA